MLPDDEFRRLIQRAGPGGAMRIDGSGTCGMYWVPRKPGLTLEGSLREMADVTVSTMNRVQDFFPSRYLWGKKEIYLVSRMDKDSNPMYVAARFFGILKDSGIARELSAVGLDMLGGIALLEGRGCDRLLLDLATMQRTCLVTIGLSRGELVIVSSVLEIKDKNYSIVDTDVLVLGEAEAKRCCMAPMPEMAEIMPHLGPWEPEEKKGGILDGEANRF